MHVHAIQAHTCVDTCSDQYTELNWHRVDIAQWVSIEYMYGGWRNKLPCSWDKLPSTTLTTCLGCWATGACGVVPCPGCHSCTAHGSPWASLNQQESLRLDSRLQPCRGILPEMWRHQCTSTRHCLKFMLADFTGPRLLRTLKLETERGVWWTRQSRDSLNSCWGRCKFN